jgi:hypothetical protein
LFRNAGVLAVGRDNLLVGSYELIRICRTRDGPAPVASRSCPRRDRVRPLDEALPEVVRATLEQFGLAERQVRRLPLAGRRGCRRVPVVGLGLKLSDRFAARQRLDRCLWLVHLPD